MTKQHGSCLCGAVTYDVVLPLRPSMACHCTQCRKTSGHYYSATQVDNDRLTVQGGEHLTWFRSSETAQRAFCSICGSSLFWEEDGAGRTSIGTGTLDLPTGLTTSTHIFVEDKGDYYVIPEEEMG